MRRRSSKSGRTVDLSNEVEPSVALTYATRVVGCDPYRAEFRKLMSGVAALDAKSRNQLLRVSEQALDVRTLRYQERTRVSLVKLLVALLPHSMGQILRWLKRRGGQSAYEVHFTLFCFLDRVQEMPCGRRLAPRILAEVQKYLMNVRTETAHAAWMAGDLIGDHWRSREALPTLLRTVTSARHAAGRRGALHGIEHIIRRLRGKEARMVREVLRRVVRTDGNPGVRREAEAILSDVAPIAGSTRHDG
jgi:hypothetical protein